MFTYYLCDDNDTIYRMILSIKQEEKNHYLSLLDNYLSELVFIEENKFKKILEKELIEKENKDYIYSENDNLLLEKNEVLNIEKIEEYLPYIVTLKKKKYSFLRPYTIFMLINLLSDDISRVSNPLIKDVVSSIKKDRCCYLDFNSVHKFFFDQFGEKIKDKSYDYDSLRSLIESLDITIELKYSANELRCFWNGDDAEITTAESIVRDAASNKDMLKILKLVFSPFDEQQRTLK